MERGYMSGKAIGGIFGYWKFESSSIYLPLSISEVAE
jgi:hypothetical protein